MMTKIFGAVLIISGGYFIGNVRVIQGKKRLHDLSRVCDLLEIYIQDLKQYRKSMEESLSGHGPLALSFMKYDFPSSLIAEDREMLTQYLDKIKNSSYKVSVTQTDNTITELHRVIDKLKKESASQWKALPLVTASIGFLIAVLLF